MHSVNDSEVAGSELNVVDENRRRQDEVRRGLIVKLHSTFEKIRKVEDSLKYCCLTLSGLLPDPKCNLSNEDSVIRESIESLGYMQALVPCLFEGVTAICKRVDDLLIVAEEELVVEDAIRMGSPGHMIGLLELNVGFLEQKVGPFAERVGKIEGNFKKEDFLSSIKEMKLLYEICKPMANWIQSCFSFIKVIPEPKNCRGVHQLNMIYAMIPICWNLHRRNSMKENQNRSL